MYIKIFKMKKVFLIFFKHIGLSGKAYKNRYLVFIIFNCSENVYELHFSLRTVKLVYMLGLLGIYHQASITHFHGLENMDSTQCTQTIFIVSTATITS